MGQINDKDIFKLVKDMKKRVQQNTETFNDFEEKFYQYLKQGGRFRLQVMPEERPYTENYSINKEA